MIFVVADAEGGPAFAWLRRGKAWTDYVQEIAIGPVVLFDERPKRNDQGIDIAIGPKPVAFRRHGHAQRRPLGRAFESLGGFAEVPLPPLFRLFAQVPKVSLGCSKRGQFTFFRIGIER